MKVRNLLLLTTLLAACTGKPSPPGPVPAPGPVLAPAPGPTVVTTVAPVPSTAPGAPPPAPVRAFDESLLRGREFLLEAAGPGEARLRDPVVGPLGTDAGLSAAVKGFFAGVGAGTLSAETLVPRWATYLKSWAVRAKASGLGTTTVHVGEALPESQGETLVPVHIRSADKDWKGWVALVGAGSSWLVSDVQVVELAPQAGPFDPESGGQEISSPSRR